MKFCNKCGAPCNEGAKFCTKCGNPFSSYVQDTVIIETQPEPPKPVEPAFTAPNPVDPAFTSGDAQFTGETPVYTTAPGEMPKKKKKKGLAVALISSAAVIAVAACLFFFTNIFGNHRILTTEYRSYYSGECTCTERYFYDGSDCIRQERSYSDEDYTRIWTYQYDGKHNMVSATLEYTDEDYVFYFDVNTYVEDGLTYNQYFDEDGYLCLTDVYDSHGTMVAEYDENDNLTWEGTYEYDIFGKITSAEECFYYEDETHWYKYEVDYDGHTYTQRCVDAYDWDEYEDFYYESPDEYDWEFSYFW